MDEYINRDDLLKAAWDKPTLALSVYDIGNIKPVDVAPVRHARWGVEVGMNFFKERNCPVCKKRIESNFWNYCPNCGAKMDGELNK